ncbi:methionine-rich copper-binding protein CopC [Cellulosimicrobium cellulans]|uniref:copper resistance CopC family protein n=1 Tax=Cellulosimicrobium cellulans TaxID=1710 RepID=UPI00195B9C98|nr:copper resistance CopC family protein [Cellulosimicrobium cellulans]MBM7818131.1 methionine-rich copper-binding protein CopC [Cellulosimicrobium cellulans]
MTLSLRRPLSAVPALLALVAAAALALGLTAALATLTAAPASAHDRILSSDPADGAQLATPPTAITLTFNTEPLPVEPQVVVSDSAGTVVTQGAPAIDGSTATFALDPAVALGGDTYTVAWRVVSSDGHPIEGTFAFTVAAQPEAPVAEEPTTDEATPEEPASEEATTDAAEETSPEPATPVATDAEDGGSSVVPVLVGLGALVVAAAVVVVIVVRRRGAATGDDAPHDPED